MYIQNIQNSFKEREPIMRDELKKIMRINSENSFNQAISYMVSFNLLKRLENGIFFIPSSNTKFGNLKPSLQDVIYKKYLINNNGIRTGAYLLYKNKLTSQVSEYYEILSNSVSSHTRSKKEFQGKVIVSYPKFEINDNNYLYIEFLELIKYINLSDYNSDENIVKLRAIIKDSNLIKEKIIHYSNYYKGKRLAKFHKYLEEVIDYEVT